MIWTEMILGLNFPERCETDINIKRYAENGGAQRHRFSIIPEKPDGVVKMTPTWAKVNSIFRSGNIFGFSWPITKAQ